MEFSVDGIIVRIGEADGVDKYLQMTLPGLPEISHILCTAPSMKSFYLGSWNPGESIQ
jgi:hypothetical protein